MLLQRALAACAAASALASSAPPPGFTVFRNMTDGYHTFRLPAMASLGSSGGLLVCAEARARLGFTPPGGDTLDCFGAGASSADWKCTNKDVACKRSADGGRTWGALAVLAQASDAFFFTNPQLLVDAPRGLVFLEYMRCVPPAGGGNSFVNCTAVLRRSADGGAHWTAPLDLPPSPQSSTGGFGGIVTASGRLVFSPPSGKDTGALISDDGGATWRWGAPPARAGESELAELAPGGELLLTVRQRNNSRLLFSSQDGGMTWDAGAPQRVSDPDCEASLIAVERQGAPGRRRLLFANPHTSGMEPYALGRHNVTVQASDDGGVSWQPILLVAPGPSAYTSLVQLAPEGPLSCGVAFEWSTDYPIDFEGVNFLLFDCHALPPATEG